MYAYVKVDFFCTIMIVLLVQVVVKLVLHPLFNVHRATPILNIIEILVLPHAIASPVIMTMAFHLIVKYVGSAVIHAEIPILAILAK